MKVKSEGAPSRFGAVSIDQNANVVEAMDLMQRLNIHHLIVTEKDSYTGLISDRLIWKNAFRKELNGLDQGKTVASVMSPKIEPVSHDTDILAIVELMKKHEISVLPTVTDGVISGVITESDAIRILPELIKEKDDGGIESFTDAALSHPVVQKIMQSLSSIGI